MKNLNTDNNNSAVLYIVGTPIGNLQDMTFRAVSVLKNCDLILAEDTRHSIHLLQNFSISTQLRSYHQHNEQERTAEILSLLEQNKKIALITDAGMPMISDPGYVLVKAALEHNYKITVVPGPTALTSAISISGIDCTQFCFAGFLSSKQASRLKNLTELYTQIEQQRAVILYEAPHRVLKCLEDIQTVFGSEHRISVIKEITKSYEAVYFGTIETVLDKLTKLDAIKGEYVIIISGNSELKEPESELEQRINSAVQLFYSENINTKTTVKIVSELFKVKKNYVYNLAIKSIIN
ncbi:MAG: 16S rRNA (cytidine(1402)-2'-O)-methyltransferase [Gammaproteobacteria bacterium]|nr:16S rRNA (cytidine(1402)-2'-O)-methyltransferase [Gammaproteobacteria bacterium]